MKSPVIINQSPPLKTKEVVKPLYIYIIKSGAEFYDSEGKHFNYYKIGVSNSPVNRLKTLQTGCPFLIYLQHTFATKKAYKVEKKLHKKVAKYSANGEWFRVYEEDTEDFFDRIYGKVYE